MYIYVCVYYVHICVYMCIMYVLHYVCICECYMCIYVCMCVLCIYYVCICMLCMCICIYLWDALIPIKNWWPIFVLCDGLDLVTVLEFYHSSWGRNHQQSPDSCLATMSWSPGLSCSFSISIWLFCYMCFSHMLSTPTLHRGWGISTGFRWS